MTSIPKLACGQLLMQPHYSPGFNSWGVFHLDQWHQVGGTSVELTTNEALAELVATNSCMPNSDPVEIPISPEKPANTNLVSSTPTTAIVAESPGHNLPAFVTPGNGVAVVTLGLMGAYGWSQWRRRRKPKMQRRAMAHPSINVGGNEDA